MGFCGFSNYCFGLSAVTACVHTTSNVKVNLEMVARVYCMFASTVLHEVAPFVYY